MRVEHGVIEHGCLPTSGWKPNVKKEFGKSYIGSFDDQGYWVDSQVVTMRVNGVPTRLLFGASFNGGGLLVWAAHEEDVNNWLRNGISLDDKIVVGMQLNGRGELQRRDIFVGGNIIQVKAYVKP